MRNPKKLRYHQKQERKERLAIACMIGGFFVMVAPATLAIGYLLGS